MDFKNELAKYGYSANNSIPVETLVNEILPNLFSAQNENKYSEEDVKKAFEQGEANMYISQNTDSEDSILTLKSYLNINEWFKKFKNK
jgi:hypothetical protein